MQSSATGYGTVRLSHDVRRLAMSAAAATIHVHASQLSVRYRLADVISVAVSGNGGSTCNAPLGWIASVEPALFL
jgi:hypothetical protein